MICVVVLQNCMSSVEGETGPYSETCVMCDVDGKEEISIKVEDARDIKEEISIKVEDAIDIKDEIPEATTSSSIKTEREVGFMVCVRWLQLMLLGHCPKKEIVKLHLTISCFMLHCVCHLPLEIWIAILKRRDFMEVIVINGRIILKCILKK